MKSKETENKKTKSKKENIKTSTLLYSIGILIAAVVISIGIAIYGFGLNNRLIQQAEAIIPYPAAILNYTSFVRIGELEENLQSVEKFYENQDFSKVGMRVDFSTADGKKRLQVKKKEVLNKMIEDRAIEILARKQGIKVTNNQVQQNISRKLEEYGSQSSARESLSKLYGWTINDFAEKIVKPDLYRNELEKIFSKEDNSAIQAKNEIEAAKKELDQKKDFAEVARKYSKGSTASEGGELGWFKKEQLVSEIAGPVFSLAGGKRSDILESSLGFHIVEVEDKKTEENANLVKIRQIFVPKKTFADWLEVRMKSVKIFTLLKNYYWDKENQTLEFRDAGLREFEKELINSPSGDASVMF